MLAVTGGSKLTQFAFKKGEAGGEGAPGEEAADEAV